MKNKFFETSFGRKIPFIPGYRDAHSVKKYKQVFSTLYQQDLKAPMEPSNFFKDIFEYFMMLDFLESLGVNLNWNTALDIGGAEGTISRILKTDNRVDYANCIEVRDASERLTDDHFQSLMDAFRAELADNNYDGILGKRWGHYTPDTFGYCPPNEGRNWRIGDSGYHAIDNYLMGDIFDHDEKYDLVTAFLCMEYFDYVNLFEKVEQLLNPGGTFFFIVNYWWWPVNSTTIVGDFPYLCQRLTGEDFERYFTENYPEEKEETLKIRGYFHKGRNPTTLNGYINAAEQQGLSCIGARPLLPLGRKHHKTPYPPVVLNEHPDTNLIDVLEDIRQYRKDVNMVDLRSAFVMAAFTKAPKSEERLESSI